jgi:fumarate hydratase class I
MKSLVDSLVELIRRASTDLPADVEAALQAALGREEPGSVAAGAIETILENVGLARADSTPICQDTGTPVFYVSYPAGQNTIELRRQIEAAVAQATKKALLRPNAVDTLTGRNTGNGLGLGLPVVYFEERAGDQLEVSLLLKGGGSENVGAQYALPSAALSAGRDLDGVRRVVLDGVRRAQGRGCAPAVLGIAIGGDRATGRAHAARQLLRGLDEASSVQELAELEGRLLAECNQLGIGPMGFGGKTTVLGVRIGLLHRHPASYFVTIAYMCWACRRARMSVRRGKVTFTG